MPERVMSKHFLRDVCVMIARGEKAGCMTQREVNNEQW